MIKKDRRYIKLFWRYSTITIIPIFLLSFLTIGVLFKEIAKDIEIININMIEQSINRIDSEIKKTFSLFNQIEKDIKIQDFISKQSFENDMDVYELSEIMEQLKFIKTNNTTSKKLGFYLENLNCVITDDSVMTLEEFFKLNFQTKNFTLDDLNEHLTPSGLVSRFFCGKSRDGDDLIIWCKEMKTINTVGYVSVFSILDKDAIIYSNKLNNEESDLGFALIDSNKNLIIESDGFNYVNLKKKNSSKLIFVKSTAIDGQYIYYLPDGGLKGNVNEVVFMFVILVIIAVLISLYLTHLNTRKINKSILGLLNENEQLEVNISEHLDRDRDRILTSLLYNTPIEYAKNVTTMAQCGINFAGKYYAVMTISRESDDINAIYSSAIDDAWAKFNDIIKLKVSAFDISCEIIRTGIDSYTYILNYSTSNVFKHLRMLPTDIIKSHGIFVNIGIGDEIQKLENLYISYEGALSALRYGIKEKSGEVIFYDEISSVENTQISYSEEKEKIIMNHIRNGDSDIVSEIFDEMYAVNFKERYISNANLRWLIISISLMLHKVLDDVYAANLEKHEKYARVCNNIYANKNVEDCYNILREICLDICQDIGNQTKDERIKGQIVDYIANNYRDVSLSLEALATHLNISYYYVSRLFKKYFDTTFLNYVTILRIEKAKELLIFTDDTIDNIAVKTGFVGKSSLIRAFKKHCNVTPGQFREK